MHGFGKISLGAAALVLAGLVQAGGGPAGNDQVLVETDAHAVVARQQEIRAEADAGRGLYKDMSQSAKRELHTHQDVVLGLLDGKERSTDLPEAQQIELFNSLEAISAILNRAEDERMVCRRERTIGTRLTTTVCKTVAERRAEQDQARDVVGGWQRSGPPDREGF